MLLGTNNMIIQDLLKGLGFVEIDYNTYNNYFGNILSYNKVLQTQSIKNGFKKLYKESLLKNTNQWYIKNYHQCDEVIFLKEGYFFVYNNNSNVAIFNKEGDVIFHRELYNKNFNSSNFDFHHNGDKIEAYLKIDDYLNEIKIKIKNESEINFKMNGFGKINSIIENEDKYEVEYLNSCYKKMIFTKDFKLKEVFFSPSFIKKITSIPKKITVNSYTELNKYLNDSFELFNLLNDKNLKFISEELFEKQTNFLKKIVLCKEKIFKDEDLILNKVMSFDKTFDVLPQGKYTIKKILDDFMDNETLFEKSKFLSFEERNRLTDDSLGDDSASLYYVALLISKNEYDPFNLDLFYSIDNLMLKMKNIKSTTESSLKML